ncbi:MAG: S-methyl-5-thioribose-1-phosphate isomerase [Vulcanimicrobiaceae bacterium]
MAHSTSLEAVRWTGGVLEYLDQRLLPHEERMLAAASADEIETAIKTLAVRGAPAIGVFGAYGVALLRETIADDASFQHAAQRVRNARPTAVNLAWAVDRVLASADMRAEAQASHREQQAMDRRLAQAALELFPKNGGVITHCNTGPIATAGGGTALGAIIAAHRAGKRLRVFVDETRPLLQGARLTIYELERAGVDATLMVDSAAAIAMQRKSIDLVIVGADRIAANGDTANKIGTYALAILAAHHGIPCYVAAPRSTVDFSMRTGEEIPIEERHPAEVRAFAGAAAAGERTAVYNPAFDVTPGHLVTAIVTEYGIVRPPYSESVPGLADRPNIGVLA